MEVIVTRKIDEDELYHYGVKGMKWGRRKSRAEAEREAGMYRTSRGTKIAPAKNAYVRTLRNLSANRAVEAISKGSTRNGGRHLATAENIIKGAKLEQRIAKDSRDMREYNAHIKDLRRGTGTKHLDKAIRKNKIDEAREKVDTSTTKLEAAFFGDATRRKAAKYMVDKNMSLKDAKKKANKEAIRNTAILLGAYGGLTIAQMYAEQKR